MSAGASWLVLTHSRSKGSTRLVALTLATCADRAGYVDITVGKLCTLTALSERTVQYATSALVELGELSVESADGCNRYRLLDASDKSTTAPGAKVDTTEGNPRRTSQEWCNQYGVDVRDPDGWREAGAPPWDEPITLADFLARARRSTVRDVASVDWAAIARDAGVQP